MLLLLSRVVSASTRDGCVGSGEPPPDRYMLARVAMSRFRKAQHERLRMKARRLRSKALFKVENQPSAIAPFRDPKAVL